MHPHLNSQSFSEFLFVKALKSAVQSLSLKIRHDHIFRTSRFFPTGLELLQICIKLLSRVESCSHRLTHLVRVKLASIYSNNWIANICRLADVSLINNSFACEHYWTSSNLIFPTFESKSLSLSVKGENFPLVELCRQVLVRFGNVHPSLSIWIPLLWQNSTIFCIAANVRTTSMFLYQRKKSLNDCIFSSFLTFCK